MLNLLHLNDLGNFPISLHTEGYDTSDKNKEKLNSLH